MTNQPQFVLTAIDAGNLPHVYAAQIGIAQGQAFRSLRDQGDGAGDAPREENAYYQADDAGKNAAPDQDTLDKGGSHHIRLFAFDHQIPFGLLGLGQSGPHCIHVLFATP